MSANPYESPETPGQPPTTGRRGFRLVELLVVVALIGLLIACLLPFRRGGSRAAARRMSCQNNLRQISLGLRSYLDEYGSFPPAYSVDAAGNPLHSWRTLILPFAGQKALYEQIDLSKPWDHPANQAACDTKLSIYQCPAGNVPNGHTTYLAVVARGGCFLPTESRKLSDIADDPNRTLMVIEVPVDRSVPWMSPRDANEGAILGAMRAREPPHPTGANAAFVDASVKFISTDTPLETLRALVSIAGGDDATVEAGF